MKNLTTHLRPLTLSLALASTTASLPAAVTMTHPLTPATLELDGTVCRDNHVYVAEPRLASARYQESPGSVIVSGNAKNLSRLFDDNADTWWSADKVDCEITIDLGRIQEITSIEWDGYTYGETFPTAFEILTSPADVSADKTISFTRTGPVRMDGPSGTSSFKDGLIYDNVDSHEVRLTLAAPLKARHLKFRIHQSSDQHPARLSRFEAFGSARNAHGTLIASFTPQSIAAWGNVILKGEGITCIQWRPGPDATGWTKLADNRIPASESVSNIQLRITLDNQAGSPARLDSLAVTLDGVVAPPPSPLVPANATQIASRTPILLWSGGANADYLPPQTWRVQISGTSDFSPAATLTLDAGNQCQTTVDLSRLPSPASTATGATFHWRVGRLTTNGEVETWSAPSSFTLTDAPLPLASPSPFGINMGLDWRPWGAELARDAGFSWARLDIPWHKVQPQPDVWNWERKDKMVTIAREWKISLLGILGYPPRDQSTAPASRDNWRSYPPASEAAWVNYVTTAATRYCNDVAAWEIWNEHNHRGFFSGTPAQYARLLQLGYITIKNISPRALVTFGGHAGFSPQYLDSVTAVIGNSYWDILNWHCYPGMPDEPYYQNWLATVFDYQRRHALNKPVWLTEIGSMRRGLPGGKINLAEEDKIAAITVAHLAANLQTFPGATPNRIDKLFWFQLIEGHGYGKPQQWAMVVDKSVTQTPPDRLPAFDAYAHAVRLLEGVRWLETATHDGLVRHHFRLPPSSSGWTDLYVIWASHPVRDEISTTIKTTAPVELRDTYGKPLLPNRIKRIQENVTLTIDHGVYFLLAPSPCIIARSQPSPPA
ncbi:beta-1,4-xylanase [Opitutaceae bacterium TAV1]|nr:beta-1,4-xylanase [Opitutaceae bacterium TAV1]